MYSRAAFSPANDAMYSIASRGRLCGTRQFCTNTLVGRTPVVQQTPALQRVAAAASSSGEMMDPANMPAYEAGEAQINAPDTVNPRWAVWAEQQAQQELQQGLEEYAALKATLLSRQQRTAAFLALYLLLVGSAELAACSALGSLTASGYLLWLMRDVDRIKGTDPAPMLEVLRMRPGVGKTISRIIVGYTYALQPRLLVPILLAGAQWYFNQYCIEKGLEPLDLGQQTALLAGYFTYKAALYGQVYEENKATVDPETLKAKRPRLVDVEDTVDIKTLMKREKKQQQAAAEVDTTSGNEEVQK